MEPGKKHVALVTVAVYSRPYYSEQSWRRRLPTKQERWHEKAKKAGLRKRTYLIPDHLDELMLNHINSPDVDPYCTSKSIMVQTALEKFFGLEKPINRRVGS